MYTNFFYSEYREMNLLIVPPFRDHCSVSLICGALLITTGLGGCGQQSPTSNAQSPTLMSANGSVATPAPMPTTVASPIANALPNAAIPVTVDRLPGSLLGIFAASVEACTSSYRPLVVKADQLDFGWGQATFNSIERQGSKYRIKARLTGEGQKNGPEQVVYTLSAQPDGKGIVLGDPKNGRTSYRPCAGKISGVSVGQNTSSISTTTPTTTGVLPLKTGAYVREGTSCSNPPNAALRFYTGRGTSGSATRACRMAIKSHQGNAYNVSQSCEDSYDGNRTSEAQTITITSATRFQLKTANGIGSYRLCPKIELPDAMKKQIK